MAVGSSSWSWHTNPLQMLHEVGKLLIHVDAGNICDNKITLQLADHWNVTHDLVVNKPSRENHLFGNRLVTQSYGASATITLP